MITLAARLIDRTCVAKIEFDRQLADLLIELGLLALDLLGRSAFVAGHECHLGAIQEPLLPGMDLVRMNPVACGQLRHRRIALDRRQRYLRLEHRRVLPAILGRHIPLLYSTLLEQEF